MGRTWEGWKARLLLNVLLCREGRCRECEPRDLGDKAAALSAREGRAGAGGAVHLSEGWACTWLGACRRARQGKEGDFEPPGSHFLCSRG